MDRGLDRLATFTTAAVAGVIRGLIEAIPGAAFVLQTAGIGTLVATSIAYWWRRRDPSVDVPRIIAGITVLFALGATAIQLLSLAT